MDTNVKSTKRGTLFDTTWESDASKLVSLRQQMPRLKYVSCYLPFGWVETESNYFLFSEFTDVNNLTLILNKKHKLRAGFMTLFMKDQNGKGVLGVKQTFPAKFENQIINKKPNYDYHWTKNEIAISKLLGTTTPKSIKKQALTLLSECKRFLFMYCDANIKLNQE